MNRFGHRLTALAMIIFASLPGTPAAAQNANPGAILGGIVAGAILGGILHGMSNHNTAQQHANKPKHPDAETADTGAPKDKTDTDAALKALGQRGDLDPIIRVVAVKSIVTTAGSRGVVMLGTTEAVDARPDVEAQERTLIELVKSDKDATGGGDVTISSLDRAIGDLYVKDGRLNKFETFRDEGWTAEHVKVAMLLHADAEIGNALFGNLRGRVRMADIDPILERAAQSVYRDTFASQELMAMNREIETFARVVREHSARKSYIPADPNQLVALAELLVGDVYKEYLARSPNSKRSSILPFGYRIRAERVAIHCFADHVIPKATPVAPGAPAPAKAAVAVSDSDDDAAMSDTPVIDPKPVVQQPEAVKTDILAVVRALATDGNSDCRAPLANLIANLDQLRLPVSRKAIWSGTNWDDAAVAETSDE